MRSLADVAALIGEPTRAAMLVALLDGEARPAGALAQAAGLSAPATSLHLGKLLQGGLLTVSRQGRHRYYRLANPEVGRALEALGAVVTAGRAALSETRTAGLAPGLRLPGLPLASPERRAFCAARTCYDHLAGALSIHLTSLFERERVLRLVDADARAAPPARAGRPLDGSYQLAERGQRWLLDAFELDAADLLSPRRPLARRCLDWTERKPHLSGALGAALLAQLLRKRWLLRTSTRALRVSPLGRARLAKLGVPPELLAPGR